MALPSIFDQRQTLGTSGLQVSPVCVGTHQFGGSWGSELDGVADAIRFAMDHGVNFIDTAEAYGWGAANRALSEALGGALGTRRDDFVICSKVGLRPDSDAPLGRVRDASRNSIRAALDRSLQTLGVDYVDILMLHYPDDSAPLDETIEAFREAIDSGKARSIGLSNHSLEQIDAVAGAVDVAVAQFPLSLLSREPGSVIAAGCRARTITGMAWGPLGQGFLTGSPPIPDALVAGDYRAAARWFDDGGWSGRLAASRKLNQLAAAHGVTASQLALAWIRAAYPGTVPVFGALGPEQASENIGSLTIELTASLAREIEATTADAPPLDLWDAVPENPLARKEERSAHEGLGS